MYLILAAIAFIWFFIIFLDTIFKSCMLYPYVRALSTFGVEIKLVSIFWTITRFNRYINRMGLYQAKFLKIWFQVGAVVTILIFIPCISMSVFKLLELVGTLNIDAPSNSSSAVFDFQSSKVVLVEGRLLFSEIIDDAPEDHDALSIWDICCAVILPDQIPGYNFPLSYWKLYMCVLLVSSVIHEFGHALAASRLGIGVESFGFAFILFAPVSFVNVRFDNLGHSTRWERLYVYCAGIWHNIVLSLLCLFTLTYFSLLISPLYSVGGGVQVFHVNELSPLNHHLTGLTPGERIYALSDCAVKDFDSWTACLQEIAEEPRGLCVPKNSLYNHTGRPSSNAGAKSNADTAKPNGPSPIILPGFAQVIPKLRPTTPRSGRPSSNAGAKSNADTAKPNGPSPIILPGFAQGIPKLRPTTPRSETIHPESCIESADKLYFDVEMPKYQVGVCLHARTAVQSFKICTEHSECDRHTLCGFPRLPKSHRFIIIKRYEKPPVLYVGSVIDLIIDAKVTEFIPKLKFLSPNIPEAIKEFLQYALIFSNGLACLNVLPIFALDGIFILENLVHILLRFYVPYEGRKLIIEAISSFTLLVFCSLIAISAYHMSA